MKYAKNLCHITLACITVIIGLCNRILQLAGFNQADDNLRKKFIKYLHWSFAYSYYTDKFDIDLFIRRVSRTTSKIAIFSITFVDGHISFINVIIEYVLIWRWVWIVNLFHRLMVWETSLWLQHQEMETSWKRMEWLFRITHKFIQQERDHIQNNF